MPVLAHIGNIPVEEWLPFVAPVVVVYFVARSRRRRRAKEIAQIPEAAQLLDERTVKRVVEHWAQTRHHDLAARHVAVFYPPGPDGRTPEELAEQIGSDADSIAHLLDELEDLGYLERETGDEPLWLSTEGFDALSEAESVLLETVKEREAVRAQV